MRNASVHIVVCQCQAQWHPCKYCRSRAWFHIESSRSTGSSPGLCVPDGSEVVTDFSPSTLNIKVEINKVGFFNKVGIFLPRYNQEMESKLCLSVWQVGVCWQDPLHPQFCWEPSWHPQLMTGLNFPRSNLISVQLCRLTICSLIVSLLTVFSVEQFERSGKPCFGDMEVFSHLKCNFTPCVAQ